MNPEYVKVVAVSEGGDRLLITAEPSRAAVVATWAITLWRVALVVLISVLAWQAYNLRNLPSWTERQVTREADATRAAALSAIGDTRKDVLGQVAALRKDVMSRADATLQVADKHLTALDGNVAGLSGTLDTQLKRTGDSVVEVAGDLRPALAHVNSITGQVDDAAPLFLDCDHNPDCVFNRYVGASKGVELAARNFSLMSTDAGKALPSILRNVDLFTASSIKASDKTAEVMGNFAKATKPLPKWVRIGLAVAPPVAGAAAGAASTWSILH